MLDSHLRLGPAAMWASGLLKKLMQIGAQEKLERLKLSVRDIQIVADIDELERGQAGNRRVILRPFFGLVTWLGHASHLSGRIILWMCKRVTFLALVLRAAMALQDHRRWSQYPLAQ